MHLLRQRATRTIHYSSVGTVMIIATLQKLLCYFNKHCYHHKLLFQQLVEFTVLCWFVKSMCKYDITKRQNNTTFVVITFVCYYSKVNYYLTNTLVHIT